MINKNLFNVFHSSHLLTIFRIIKICELLGKSVRVCLISMAAASLEIASFLAASTFIAIMLYGGVNAVASNSEQISWLGALLEPFNLDVNNSTLGAFVAVLLLISIILRVMSVIIQANLIYTFEKKIAELTFSKTLGLGLASFYMVEASERLKSITSDSGLIAQGLILPFIHIIQSTGATIFLITLMLFVSVEASFLIVGGLICISLVLYIPTRFLMKRSGKLVEDGNSNRYFFANAMIKNFKSILLYCEESFFINKFLYFQGAYLDGQRKSKILSQVPRAFVEYLFFFVVIGVLIFNFDRLQNSEFVVYFSFFVFSVLRLFPFVLQNVNLMNTLSLYRSTGINFLNSQSEISRAATGNVEDERGDHSSVRISDGRKFVFHLSDLSVRHEQHADNIIKNAEFRVGSGETLLVFGESGAGKSTLLDTLIGLVPMRSGSVAINERLVPVYNVDIARQLIGYVPQEPVFTASNILENLTPRFSESDVSIEDAEMCLKAASLYTDIIQKFGGIEKAELGPGAVQLSGGQRKRLALARALLRNRPLLVLDEPTAGLDVNLSKNLVFNIREYFPNVAIIIATHDDNLVSENCIKYYLHSGYLARSMG